MKKLLLLLIAVAATGYGGAIAVTPGSLGSQNSQWNGDATIGWQFSVTAPISVTELGFFDAGGDGLADSHPVGIWNSSGTLLGSITIPSGTGATLNSGFRWVPISPFGLGAGDYVIGGYGLATSTDQFQFELTGSTTIPQIVLGAAVDVKATGLTMPDSIVSNSTEGYFGPNFMATVASTVPEPSTFFLFGLGLVGLGLSRKRNRS